MAIRLHFWGADQTVTGSSHHLECAGQNILLDCGLFQGRRQDTADINSHLALTPEQLAGKAAPGLNAVVLSHAHIDHSRRSAAAGEAGVSRADLHDAGDHRPVRADAEGLPRTSRRAMRSL